MLRSTDPLPARPRRIVVAGTSGTGKTTLAQRLAHRLDLPHVEIDALFRGPGWQPRPEFLVDVVAFTQTDRWVTEWQYAPARPLVAARADLMVWLDLPFRTTLRRVVVRTVRRRLRREVLWNGNVEPPWWTVATNREHIVRWSISTRTASPPPCRRRSTRTRSCLSSGCARRARSSTGSHGSDARYPCGDRLEVPRVRGESGSR